MIIAYSPEKKDIKKSFNELKDRAISARKRGKAYDYGEQWTRLWYNIFSYTAIVFAAITLLLSALGTSPVLYYIRVIFAAFTFLFTGVVKFARLSDKIKDNHYFSVEFTNLSNNIAHFLNQKKKSPYAFKIINETTYTKYQTLGDVSTPLPNRFRTKANSDVDNDIDDWMRNRLDDSLSETISEENSLCDTEM
uniref:SLATT domain-containing protein n=1 Tax=Pithovirus LCPAC401 TaxID=2506595 RepID=A0A481Z9H2_9VIRU|nr:MAG: uncharacterized protein LCPAC401_01910 [Pithovirus LCPAC401]